MGGDREEGGSSRGLKAVGEDTRVRERRTRRLRRLRQKRLLTEPLLCGGQWAEPAARGGPRRSRCSYHYDPDEEPAARGGRAPRPGPTEPPCSSGRQPLVKRDRQDSWSSRLVTILDEPDSVVRRTHNVTLLGERVFADAMEGRIWSELIAAWQVAPEARGEHPDRKEENGGRPAKPGAEIKARRPQAEGGSSPQTRGRGLDGPCPRTRAGGGGQPCDTSLSAFRPPGS